MRAPSHVHGGFDGWARTYDRSRLQGVFFDRVHDEVIRVLRPLLGGVEAPRLLDVGCGTGRLLGRLRAELPAAARLSGVDASAPMIEVARAKAALRDVELAVAPAEALPFGEASFDAVVSTLSFHHWNDQRAGLSDVARVMRAGAPLLLVDIYATGLLAPLVRRRGRHHGVGMRNDGEVAAMLAAAGLVAVELRRILVPLSPFGIMVARRP